MHVPHTVRLAQQIRMAGSITRVNRDRTSRSLGNPRRKVLPMRNRAQTLMKKHQFRRILAATADPQHFQPVPTNAEPESQLLKSGSPHGVAFLNDLSEVFLRTGGQK